MMHWWKRLIVQSPYVYQRKPVPQPGAENLAFQTWQLPEVSPINGALPNIRDFRFADPTGLASHVIGLQGYGGIPNATDFKTTPLIDTSGNQSSASEVYLLG